MVSVFSRITAQWLIRFLRHRIGDERIIRLIQKWLKARVMDEEEWSVSNLGTPQRAVIPPPLANIYLHYVFDKSDSREGAHYLAQVRVAVLNGEFTVQRFASLSKMPAANSMHARQAA